MKGVSAIKYLFTLVGGGFLAGAFFWYQSTNIFIDNAVSTEGIVIDLELSRSNDSSAYYPILSFVDSHGNEIRFRSSSGRNPPSYSVGEPVEILYLPEDPHDASINSFFSLWGGAVIMGFLGGVFFLIGAGIMIATRMGKKKELYLKERGTPIETDFQGVELNESISVNGKHPYRILTQWHNPATSRLHVFHSNNLWFDPSNYINSDKITVFIERGNPKKYYVDISFLPELAS